ncbi:MAG: ABC transporter permease [Lachnospiraceae bacterium]|nr:ABC transporter permease [Lachnospiraceae bacterium]
MRFSDLLRMSTSSLVKRKLRTILTILGVVIGIASIVVMVSLGLGLNQQSMEMIEQYGGLTTITVTEQYGGYSDSGSDMALGNGDPTFGKITDATVEAVKALEHVKVASPVLNFQCVLRSGPYVSEPYAAYGYSLEGLRSMNWKFSAGGLPEEGDELKFIYGNLIQQEFTNASTGAGYYETGVLPEIDFMESPVFTIFDTEAYHASKSSGNSEDFGGDATASAENKTPPRKYMIHAAGILYGEGQDDYRDYSFGVYCDIEALQKTLQKVFRNKPIPGQPVKKNGSPYRNLFYSQIYVRADSVDNMEEVQDAITAMGYNAYSNFEWIEETREQSRSQQAMLGGIGAVSLLVAAIGIANTMMMSIYERTREIGVMKVLGCDLKDIRRLFLLEATLIGAFGGLLGDVLSLAASHIINAVTETTTSLIPLWLYAVGFAFAIVVGVIAGYFPSKRAMQLSPLAAIRNE